MAIEKVNIPYEILLRLDAGPVIRAAHRKDLQRVTDTETGEVFSERELDPVAVQGDDLETLLGVANAAALGTIAELEAQKAGLQERVSELNATVEELSTTVESLRAEVKALTPEGA